MAGDWARGRGSRCPQVVWHCQEEEQHGPKSILQATACVRRCGYSSRGSVSTGGTAADGSRTYPAGCMSGCQGASGEPWGCRISVIRLQRKTSSVAPSPSPSALRLPPILSTVRGRLRAGPAERTGGVLCGDVLFRCVNAFGDSGLRASGCRDCRGRSGRSCRGSGFHRVFRWTIAGCADRSMSSWPHGRRHSRTW